MANPITNAEVMQRYQQVSRATKPARGLIPFAPQLRTKMPGRKGAGNTKPLELGCLTREELASKLHQCPALSRTVYRMERYQ